MKNRMQNGGLYGSKTIVLPVTNHCDYGDDGNL
jgi:hypothetical protein